MRYVEQILDPGEEIQHESKLHWMIYLAGILFLVIAVPMLLLSAGQYMSRDPMFLWFVSFGGVTLALAGFFLLDAWIDVMGTELVITSKRVIHKQGLIYRKTVEMNLAKVESVLVDQSVLGRLFDYGTVSIRGTGAGIEPIRMIDNPLKFRSYVTPTKAS